MTFDFGQNKVMEVEENWLIYFHFLSSNYEIVNKPVTREAVIIYNFIESFLQVKIYIRKIQSIVHWPVTSSL